MHRRQGDAGGLQLTPVSSHGSANLCSCQGPADAAAGPARGGVGALLGPAWPAAHSLDMAAQMLEGALNGPSAPPQHELAAGPRRLLVPREFLPPVVVERRLEPPRRTCRT